MPEFWLGLLLLYVFAIHLGIVPVIAGSNIANIFLPAFTLCLSYSAVYVRMLRTNLIEVRRSNYFKAARSKGCLLYTSIRITVVFYLTLTEFANRLSECFYKEKQ